MAIVLSGTWETSEERKRNEESEESIVAGKRGNARGYPPSRRRVAKRCPRRGSLLYKKLIGVSAALCGAPDFFQNRPTQRGEILV